MTEHTPRRYHIIVDAFECDTKLIGDKDKVEKIIRNIAEICDMKILHGPTIMEGVPSNPGITGFAIIDFSHISVHTFTDSNEICVDIFSCKKFDYNKVKEYVKESFNLSEENTKIIDVQHKTR